MAQAAKLTEDERLVREIAEKQKSGGVTRTILKTDQRVLARVTDGIYREPAAALRELIANAYDADATEVTITTDAPRFAEIAVRDDGVGMDKEALVHLINHIGGSAKRTLEGSQLGITGVDPSRSTAGRRLIGKIGIGLFAVSQLTRHFKIITKKKGAGYQLVADVSLNTYSEDNLASDPDGSKQIQTGTVTIQSFPAEDISGHGTHIILMELQKAARDLLQSRDIWEMVASTDELDDDLAPEKFEPPAFHCGQVEPNSKGTFNQLPKLPWKTEQSPKQRFRALHDAVIAEAGRITKPSLSRTLDRYLRTLWLLSLAAPLPYLDGHPFDLTKEADPDLYVFSNEKKGKANKLTLKKQESLRSHLRLTAGTEHEQLPFGVSIDGIELARPLQFHDLPATDLDDPRKRPLLFVGKCRPPISKMPEEVSGGRDLDFEAYFLWTKKVIPTDHNGVLIRISDASGTLFDASFLGYQVAELTRLSQITAEIFVKSGLEAALNIDRESFNFGHPHAKIITGWVHRVLRQLATTQKKVAKEKRDKQREEDAKQHSTNIRRKLASKLNTSMSDLPKVELVESESEAQRSRKKGTLSYVRPIVFEGIPEPKASPKAAQTRRNVEEKLEALMQILDAYGLFEAQSFSRQQEVMNAFASVLIDEDSEEAK